MTFSNCLQGDFKLYVIFILTVYSGYGFCNTPINNNLYVPYNDNTFNNKKNQFSLVINNYDENKAYKKGLSSLKKMKLSIGDDSAIYYYSQLENEFGNKKLASNLLYKIKNSYKDYIVRKNLKIDDVVVNTLKRLYFTPIEISQLADIEKEREIEKTISGNTYNKNLDISLYEKYNDKNLPYGQLVKYVKGNKSAFYTRLALADFYFLSKNKSGIKNISDDDKDINFIIKSLIFSLDGDAKLALDTLQKIDFSDEKWAPIRILTLSYMAKMSLDNNQFKLSYLYYNELVRLDKSNIGFWFGLALSADNLEYYSIAKESFSHILHNTINMQAKSFAKQRLYQISQLEFSRSYYVR